MPNGRKRRWWLLGGAALVAAIIAAAAIVALQPEPVAGEATAGSGQPTAGTGTPTGRTGSTPADGPDPALMALLGRTEPDGTVGLEQAKQAFSYLFTPLTGVSIPAGLPDPEDLHLSGSGAVRSMLAHWDELDDAERTAVSAIAVPPPGEQPRLRQPTAAERKRDTDKASAASLLRPEVDRLVVAVAQRLGRTIPSPLVYLVDTESDGAWAWTLGLADGEVPNEGGDDPMAPNGGPAKACNMYLPPSTWGRVASAVPQEMTSTLAHEVVHCFQNFSYPTLADQRKAPGWLLEGTAEFGAIDITGAAAGNPSNWKLYLTSQLPLFERTYTAMGWWFQVQHVGRDPWTLFPTIWGGAQNSVTAYLTAGGDGDDMYDTWASTLFRQPAWGDAWEVHGVAVPGDMPPVPTIQADGGTVESPGFDIRVAKISGEVTAGADTIVRITASAPVRMQDAAGFEEVHFSQGDYCIGATCVCPEGTERAGEEVQRVTAPLALAVPGGETGNAAISDTMTLQEYCRRKPPPRPTPPGENQTAPAGSRPHALPDNPNSRGPDAPQRPAGSTGDPHLTSFDGNTFGFQAAGEFTLALADAGDLEVQARQEPARGPHGSENLTVTVTTAVAASVNGDRISLTAAPDRTELRLDGEQVDLREPRALPGGGTVAPITGGFRVGWPDGTELIAMPNGGYGLNLEITPAAGRLGMLHGMLGPYEGVERSPTMEDRDGTRYPAVTGATPTDPLYTVVGASWRVTAAGSLFDYTYNESTDTFNRPAVPTALVDPSALTQEQRTAAATACAGVDEVDKDYCEFDVAVSGDSGYAAGYTALRDVAPVQDAAVTLGVPVGPGTLAPGETTTFTADDDANALYFAGESDCAGNESVQWRVTAPDGQESLLASICEDHGRISSTTSGTWRIHVMVDAAAPEGGSYEFTVHPAGPIREFPLPVPGSVGTGGAVEPGALRGAGATDRFSFSGLQGDVLILTALPGCSVDSPLLWGLEDPNGFVVTLRTSACDDLGAQTLTTNGQWHVIVWNPTAAAEPLQYDFSTSR